MTHLHRSEADDYRSLFVWWMRSVVSFDSCTLTTSIQTLIVSFPEQCEATFHCSHWFRRIQMTATKQHKTVTMLSGNDNRFFSFHAPLQSNCLETNHRRWPAKNNVDFSVRDVRDFHTLANSNRFMFRFRAIYKAELMTKSIWLWRLEIIFTHLTVCR